MFAQVWTWSSKIRNTEKNIGVAPHNIQIELLNLCEGVKIWISNETFSLDEIGVRFHHRLVFIHPFAKGNGRHARSLRLLLTGQLSILCRGVEARQVDFRQKSSSRLSKLK